MWSAADGACVISRTLDGLCALALTPCGQIYVSDPSYHGYLGLWPTKSADGSWIDEVNVIDRYEYTLGSDLCVGIAPDGTAYCAFRQGWVYDETHVLRVQSTVSGAPLGTLPCNAAVRLIACDHASRVCLAMGDWSLQDRADVGGHTWIELRGDFASGNPVLHRIQSNPIVFMGMSNNALALISFLVCPRAMDVFRAANSRHPWHDLQSLTTEASSMLLHSINDTGN